MKIVKLQKQSSRIVKNVEYAKWVVVIPQDKIGKESKWLEGQELEVDVKDGKIILKPKKEISLQLSSFFQPPI